MRLWQILIVLVTVLSKFNFIHCAENCSFQAKKYGDDIKIESWDHHYTLRLLSTYYINSGWKYQILPTSKAIWVQRAIISSLSSNLNGLRVMYNVLSKNPTPPPTNQSVCSVQASESASDDNRECIHPRSATGIVSSTINNYKCVATKLIWHQRF